MLVLLEKRGRIVKRSASAEDLCEAVYALTQLIPSGLVTTYGELSRVLGIHPRSVARCLSRNESLVLIPCHRVVYSNGRLGGYSGPGVDFKKKLLALEGVEFSRDDVIARKCFMSFRWLLE